MRFRQFLESPLSDYRTDFQRDTEEGEGFAKNQDGSANRGRQVRRYPDGVEQQIMGRFSTKDRAVITHPRTARALEQRLSGSAYKFNILMLEDPRANVDTFVIDYVGRYVQDNGIQTEGHITFVKNSTSGHVLTPWMILHTLGHAAVARASNEMNVQLAFNRALNPLADSVCGNENPGREANFPSKRCMARIGDALVFRSARSDSENPSFNDPEEFMHELVAEFLWNGDRIRVGGPRSGGTVPALVAKVEDVVRSVLDLCVGDIIFDYF